MKSDTIYAVVDIEATSGSIGTGEGMIQFACVLMQNGEILESFETLVNPLKKVPKPIQHLTGISQSEVNKAPLFEEIAELIHDLLEDSVFVAHNVNFDYRFLNEQFEAIGLAPLTIPAIDTVALSQILFPKAYSYSLQDLVDWLGYDIHQAHNALYDARATAFLLTKLFNKVINLPLVTLEKINDIAFSLPFQTNYFFHQATNYLRENPKDLDESLVVVNQIAMKDPSKIKRGGAHKKRGNYPLSDKDKAKYFGDTFTLRQSQGELMDSLYSYFEKEANTKELAIEAPSGVGKSIGYLFPASLRSNNKNPIVISTYTTLLQNQLLDEAVPLLQRLIPFDVSAEIVKGKNNYLSLNKFKYELNQVKSEDTEAFYCMQILVWLTETMTGDFDELSFDKNHLHSFWDSIKTDDRFVSLSKEEKSYEFYDRMVENAQRADIIITNHSFLITDMKREASGQVLPDYDELILDEAHHFVRSMNQLATQRLNNSQVHSMLIRFGYTDTDDSIIGLLNDYKEAFELKEYQLKLIETNAILLDEEWRELVSYYEKFLDDERISDVGWQEIVLNESHMNTELEQRSNRIKLLFEELLFYLQKILTKLEKEITKYVKSEREMINEIYNYSKKLSSLSEAFWLIFQAPENNQVNWMEFHMSHQKQSLQFKTLSRTKQDELYEKLHQVKKIVYISSSLSVNDSITFFGKQIQHQDLEFLQFESPYKHKTQTKLLVPNGLRPIKQMSNKQYVDELSTNLETMLSDLDRNVLVLFNSVEVLQGVYNKIQSSKFLKNHQIFAQELSGSKSKILKQFKKTDNGILFGADTFFEGIDLPGDLLEIVVLTRLPFASPDMPTIKKEHDKLKKQGENIFMEDLLPRAVLKTKQAFGRLIRSNNDKGIFIILDERFVSANYSKVFQQSLPKHVTHEFVDLEDVGKVTENFLSSSSSKKES